MRFRLIAASILAAAACSQVNAADTVACFQLASRYHHVDTGVLRAISIRENGRCDQTIARNANNSVDVGCMQINSVHFSELARYGIAPSDLTDQCKNIFIGAWHYRKKINKWGNTWQAVGAYHSETPALRDRYAAEVYQIWLRYGLNK
jgi:soluble lytic murein transglycosylase-like protein